MNNTETPFEYRTRVTLADGKVVALPTIGMFHSYKAATDVSSFMVAVTVFDTGDVQQVESFTTVSVNYDFEHDLGMRPLEEQHLDHADVAQFVYGFYTSVLGSEATRKSLPKPRQQQRRRTHIGRR